ncbi:hypothetical protein CRUP_009532 [Coryphaenoides rupestris]|nr:hypothetical protein CRUP_009532 [Coryphaenoides rupestris]
MLEDSCLGGGGVEELHIMVSPDSVRLNLDCREVAEKEVKAAGNTSSDGYQVLGKMSKSIGSKGESATVSHHGNKCFRKRSHSL